MNKNILTKHNNKKQSFLTKTEKRGISEFIEEIKNQLKDNLLSVKILGSKVKGNFSSESDIDLFILVKKRDYSIMHIISGISTEIDLKYNINTSPIISSVSEHNKEIYFHTLFVKNLKREGKTIYEAK